MDTKRVIGYVRVSTEEQMVSGYGTTAQAAAIQAACTQRGWTTVDVVTEQITGARVGPLLAAVLDRMDAGDADVLMVAKLDRMSRSVTNGATIFERARRHGWAVVALDVAIDTSTPAGEVAVSMLLVFAQYERRIISDRTRVALAVAKQRGVRCTRPMSTPPDVAARIAAARAAGHSWQQIADDLNGSGVPTPRGGTEWRKSSVRSVAVAGPR